jgi:hypothetical protein
MVTGRVGIEIVRGIGPISYGGRMGPGKWRRVRGVDVSLVESNPAGSHLPLAILQLLGPGDLHRSPAPDPAGKS